MGSLVYNATDYYLFVTMNDGTSFEAQGESENDMLKVSMDEDVVNAVQNAKGDVQFSQIQSSLGTVESYLQWGSDTNKYLQYCFDEQQKGNNLQSIAVKSKATGMDIHKSSNVMITKPADLALGKQAGNRTWVFKCEKLTNENSEAYTA